MFLHPTLLYKYLSGQPLHPALQTTSSRGEEAIPEVQALQGDSLQDESHNQVPLAGVL